MRSFIFCLTVLLFSCSSNQKKRVDSILYNGHIITMNDSLPSASVVIVDQGKIIAVGGNAILNQFECDDSNKIDLQSNYLYPGFIDAHCHFYGYAKTLLSCNLVGTNSWKEVTNKLTTFSQTSNSEWLTGRGWDQNDWVDKNYPTNSELNILFPNRPVILKRIDGHAAICNQKALTLAGISENSELQGGEFVKINGKLTGVLVDNAVEMVEKIITPPSNLDLITVLKKAEKECYSLGLTTLADAGLDLETALFLDSLGLKNELSIYLYIMLNPTINGLKFAQRKGEYENDHTKICSFKLYADGALGSRGAKLKEPYCDRNDHSGMLLNDAVYFDKWCNDIKNTTKYQVNTHCIGDSANRLLLEIYGKYLKGKNDDRWRIEHAQIIDMNDFELFSKFSIIPSVQPTHATSDGPWAEDRLCNYRMKGAYAYQTLLNQNGYLPLGTDFPVEYLNPLLTFYSAVFRENLNVKNQKTFQSEEKLLPNQALYGMTLWAAKACRLEHRKGSITAGMDADFVLLNGDLLTVKKNEFKMIKVLKTIKSGKVVF
ncbi:MAG: amidohydrolase [bacterium]|nr:amidohydrolase [bacterium]